MVLSECLYGSRTASIPAAVSSSSPASLSLRWDGNMVSHRFGAGLPRSTFTPEDRTFIFRPLAIISPVWIDFRPTWSTRSWVSSRYSGSDFDMRDKELGLLSVFGFRPRRTCNIGNSVSRDRQRVRHRLDREDRHRRNRLDRIRDRHRWTGPDLGPGSTSASTGPLDTSPELDSGLLFSFSLRGLPITPLPRGQVRKVLKGPLRRSSPPGLIIHCGDEVENSDTRYEMPSSRPSRLFVGWTFGSFAITLSRLGVGYHIRALAITRPTRSKSFAAESAFDLVVSYSSTGKFALLDRRARDRPSD